MTGSGPIPSQLSVAPLSLWVSFCVGVVVLLIIDLFIFGRKQSQRPIRMATIETLLWVAVALLFNLWFGWQYGWTLGAEFFTGYLVEKTLSVDNLFIMLLIFTSLRIPGQYQHRVLFYGVFGAVVMRALFILLGMKLLHSFHWLLYIFGLILIVTSIRLLRQESAMEEKAKEGIVLRWLKRAIPTTDRFDGHHFFVQEQGVYKATPLFLALIAVEVTDLFFAIDSIPAIFAVTQDAFVAFASNTLAILGLRALYFVVAHWVGRIHYLKPGLSLILAFIGMKLLLLDVIKVPALFSLAFIFTVLSVAVVASWLRAKQTSH
jgi:tellurite resistance protein TerC